MKRKLPDYYKILGVARDADNKDIERAFRKKAMECHPDRFIDPKQKEEKTREFQELNEAYTLLSQYVKRKDYDAALQRQEAEERKNQTDNRSYQPNDETGYDTYEDSEDEELQIAILRINSLFSLTKNHSPSRDMVSYVLRFGNLTPQDLQNVLASGNPELIKETALQLQPYTSDGSFTNSFDTQGSDCTLVVRYQFTDYPDIIVDLTYTKIMIRYYKWMGVFNNGRQTETHTGRGNDILEVARDATKHWHLWAHSVLMKRDCAHKDEYLKNQYTYTTHTTSSSYSSQTDDTANPVDKILICGMFLFGFIIFLFLGVALSCAPLFVISGLYLLLFILILNISEWRAGNEMEEDEDWESDM